MPIEDIVSLWERQPLFADQSDAARRGAAARAGCRRTRARSRCCSGPPGQGVLEPVWHELRALELPMLAIAGARDEGYTAAAKRIASMAPNGRAAIVEDAGHAPQLQRPEEVARLIRVP